MVSPSGRGDVGCVGVAFAVGGAGIPLRSLRCRLPLRFAKGEGLFFLWDGSPVGGGNRTGGFPYTT